VIKLKRVYEETSEDDGIRIFVERLWPRGIKRENLNFHIWLKDIAPSNKLRKWYSHDNKKWNEFKEKYFHELNSKEDSLEQILKFLRQNATVTFIYASKETTYNSATALREYIYKHMKAKK